MSRITLLPPGRRTSLLQTDSSLDVISLVAHLALTVRSTLSAIHLILAEAHMLPMLATMNGNMTLVMRGCNINVRPSSITKMITKSITKS
mmetsp:Transcript_31001/g.99967  ORF Transcript_31001/g.99967 Transcript_31001/m.99967 type:complete len:90 (+) Transcript_31001:319-588(+)